MGSAIDVERIDRALAGAAQVLQLVPPSPSTGATFPHPTHDSTLKRRRNSAGAAEEIFPSKRARTMTATDALPRATSEHTSPASAGSGSVGHNGVEGEDAATGWQPGMRRGKLDSWERERVDDFVDAVKQGRVQVARGDLARQLRDWVNRDRPQMFYEKLVSRRHLNQKLGRLLHTRRRKVSPAREEGQVDVSRSAPPEPGRRSPRSPRKDIGDGAAQLGPNQGVVVSALPLSPTMQPQHRAHSAAPPFHLYPSPYPCPPPGSHPPEGLSVPGMQGQWTASRQPVVNNNHATSPAGMRALRDPSLAGVTPDLRGITDRIALPPREGGSLPQFSLSREQQVHHSLTLGQRGPGPFTVCHRM